MVRLTLFVAIVASISGAAAAWLVQASETPALATWPEPSLSGPATGALVHALESFEPQPYEPFALRPLHTQPAPCMTCW